MASAIATSANSSAPIQKHPSPAHSDTEPEISCCPATSKNEISPFVVPSLPPIPHSSSQISPQTAKLSLGDDELGSSDEVKVFKDEGEEEKEFISSEEIQAALLEDKSSLIQETELAIKEECAARLELRGHHRQQGIFRFVLLRYCRIIIA